MAKASYKTGVDWIARMDESGSDNALVESVVAEYISTCLLAEVFGHTREKVAKDVVRRRIKIIAFRKGYRNEI